MCIAAAIAGAAVVGGVATTVAGNKAAGAQRDAARSSNETQLAMYNQTREDQTPWRKAGSNAIDALSQFYGLPSTQSKQDPLSYADWASKNGYSTSPTDTGIGGIAGLGNVINNAHSQQYQQYLDSYAPTQSTPDYNKILSNLPGYQFQLQQGNQAVQRNLAASGLLQSGAAGKALQQYGQGVASNYATQYINGLQSLAGIGQTSVQSTGNLGANAANQIGSNQIYSGNAQASAYANSANAFNSGLNGVAGAYGQYNAYQNAQPVWNSGNSAFARYQSNEVADQIGSQPVAPLYLGGP